ncbi:MLP-like protein 43 [Senna tora]|uniref:MLP-like protein 43 n=1 Tax=Senna tora TaxID=362788 RepID=A0A834SQ45_9FABA|nr:MLP-like protein 43 [Senna tora]
MALKGKVGAETEIQSSASKFFNLIVNQVHDVQNMTDEVHETKLHQGDWHGVGSHSVKHWTYISGGLEHSILIPPILSANQMKPKGILDKGGKVVNCKEHIEEIDNANKTILFKLFDGEFGEDKYKSVKLKLKVVEKDESAIVNLLH